MIQILILLAVLLIPTQAQAQAPTVCPEGFTCVPPEDMAVFIKLLEEEQCRIEQHPEVELDPVDVFVDRKGRVYYSGNGLRPYEVHVNWCDYELDIFGKIEIQVAQHYEPDWGWRFRLKAAFGYLPIEALATKNAMRGLDGGLLFEPFFYRWANVNGYVGVRSVGAGLGFDITTNFGAYLGYALAWGTWRSNPHAALYFAF
jgi:hypothetical protein